METTANVADAIDDRELQNEHGWDLQEWRLASLPFGIRFVYVDPGRHVQTQIDAVLAMKGRFLVTIRQLADDRAKN